MPLDDTLNIKNGMNYAQFLEAILRLAQMKAEKSDDKGPFKNSLEAILSNSNLDMQKRIAHDEILKMMFEHMFIKDKDESSKKNTVFYEFQELLTTIFWLKTNPQTGSFPEMSKSSFLQILESGKILKLQKVEEVKKAATTGKGKDSKKQ